MNETDPTPDELLKGLEPSAEPSRYYPWLKSIPKAPPENEAEAVVRIAVAFESIAESLKKIAEAQDVLASAEKYRTEQRDFR